MEPTQPAKPSSKRQVVIFLTLILLAVLLSVTWVVFDRRRQPDADPIGVIDLVGKHIVLPAEEEPVIASIEDKEKLQTEFLRQGENGDKVLIYSKAKKVIIYRPSIDRIIDVGPVSIVPLDGTEAE